MDTIAATDSAPVVSRVTRKSRPFRVAIITFLVSSTFVFLVSMPFWFGDLISYTFDFLEGVDLASHGSSEFLDRVDNGEFATIYQMAPELESEGTEAQFEEYLKTVRNTLGPMRGYSMRWLSNAADEGYNDCCWEATYKVTYEHGTARVKLKLLGECGQTYLQAFSIDSPQLNTVLRCPWCKEPLHTFVQDCRRCKMPVREKAGPSKIARAGC